MSDPLATRDIRVYGRGKARAIRILWTERCSVQEICEALSVTRNHLRMALCWKGKTRIYQ